MNRRINLWWKTVICFIGILLLSGCDILSNPSDQREYFTDSDGTQYYIVNKNHFTFDGYNVLEVIVSDSEKFVLYDTENDDGESGRGEWIKDGISYPITFTDYDHKELAGKHANIVISPDTYNEKYWELSELEELPPVLAMINNDQENPGLYRWSTGAYPYNWEFENNQIIVEYLTYTRDDLHDDIYIPEKVAKFYSSESDDVSFVSDELGLCFDGKTGDGIWTLDGIDIPVMASFNQDYFTLSVEYNTADERQGVHIFMAKGTSVNDITGHSATFKLVSFPQNCNYETITTLTLQKKFK